jgi:hypothetical protein
MGGGPGFGGREGGVPGAWQPAEHGRFDSFRPEEKAAEPEPEPTPQVRNGRVLLAVLAAAALLLIVPFAIVWALTRSSGESSFEVGSCVKESGSAAVSADCSEVGAYEVVSKVADAAECPDRNQPNAILPDNKGKDRVLCLKPVAAK